MRVLYWRTETNYCDGVVTDSKKKGERRNQTIKNVLYQPQQYDNCFQFSPGEQRKRNTTQDGRNLPTNCFVSGFAFFCSEEKGEIRFCLFLFLRPRDGFEIKIRGKRERTRQKEKKSAHYIFFDSHGGQERPTAKDRKQKVRRGILIVIVQKRELPYGRSALVLTEMMMMIVVTITG